MSDSLTPALIAATSALAGVGFTQLINYLMEGRRARLQAEVARWSKTVDAFLEYIDSQDAAINATRKLRRVATSPGSHNVPAHAADHDDMIALATTEELAWQAAYSRSTQLMALLPKAAEIRQHKFMQEQCFPWRRKCFTEECEPEGPSLEKFVLEMRPWVYQPNAKNMDLGSMDRPQHTHDPDGLRFGKRPAAQTPAAQSVDDPG